MKLTYLLAGALCIAPACLADFDPKNMDTSVSPAVDFDQYAIGTWLKTNTIPADRSSAGTFDYLSDANEAKLHAILEKAASAQNPGPIEKLVGDFYSAGMDVAAVNAAGITPIKGELAQIDALKSTAEFGPEFARLHMLGIFVGFAFGSEPDPKDSDMTIATSGQAGLGLPERDYYTREDPRSKKMRDDYAAHMARMFQLAGDSPADAASETAAVIRIETALALGSRKAADLRDPVSNYNFMSLGSVEKDMPHFDWPSYLAGIGLAPPANMDNSQPEFMRALDAEIASAPLADWKAYFRWHLVHASARFISTNFLDENFAFYGTTLTGQQKPVERWRRVMGVIDGSIGEALGQLYVADNFPAESKSKALALIASIRGALRERIQSLDWMDDATKQAALKKLDAMRVKVGYPDKWIDYGTLAVDRASYVVNVQRSQTFLVKRDLAKIGKPVDKSEWHDTPPTVNAYYSDQGNEIVFPAGILQAPFFDAKSDDAVNYGSIGSIMGHEMTHGFDDGGRQFDYKGNLTDWWTPESAKRFKERSGAIVRQYGAYVAVDNIHLNGELCQGENIADLGGVKLAYAALEKTLAGKPEVRIDGFTPEQRFFLAFASNYRELNRPELLRFWVQSDPHSPGRFRVIGVLSNLDEFAKAFDVPEGAPMRRAAADRTHIW